MKVRELIDRIHEAGGKLRVIDGQLYSKRVPECLVPELRRLKVETAGILRLEDAANAFSDAQFVGFGFDKFQAACATDPVIQRLAGRFNLKPISREGLSEIDNGQQWRSLSASHLEPTNQPQRKPAKHSWISGPRCPGCRGTWHSQETLSGHVLVCRVFAGRRLISEGEKVEPGGPNEGECAKP